MKNESYRIPNPSLSDECPAIPEGATDWERQEIVRTWRNVHHYAHKIAASVMAGTKTPVQARPGTNIAQDVIEWVNARNELAVRIQGVEHRLAMQEDPDV